MSKISFITPNGVTDQHLDEFEAQEPGLKDNPSFYTRVYSKHNVFLYYKRKYAQASFVVWWNENHSVNKTPFETPTGVTDQVLAEFELQVNKNHSSEYGARVYLISDDGIKHFLRYENSQAQSQFLRWWNENYNKTREPFDSRVSLADTELLALLAEECGEVMQVIGKILRHGWESRNPTVPDSPANDVSLCYELGDVLAAMTLLVNLAPDRVKIARVDAAALDKLEKVKRWLHHSTYNIEELALPFSKSEGWES